MDTSEFLTLIIALYGAILSSVVFWRERQKELRTIRVTCDVSFGVSPIGVTGRYLSIGAVNVGHRPITIIQAGLKLNTGENVIQPMNDPNFYPIPKKLEDSDSVTVYMDWDGIINTAKEKKVYYTKAFAQDAEGKIYSTRLPVILKELGVAK